MNIKKTLILLIFFSFIGLLFPKSSGAIDLKEVLTSEDSVIFKIKEGVEYFFSFKIENKVAVLEKHAEKRLNLAQEYVKKENVEKVQNLLQNYLQLKEKQNNLLGKTNNEEVLDKVAKQTIEQQKTMEKIKTKIDEGGKKEVIQVQEQVVNQVAKRVVDVNGKEGATEFLNEVLHVWAPGTGPGGGEAGVVYEGGGKLIYAPGTGPGGQGRVVIEGGEMKFATGTSMDAPGADIKTVEIKTGGGENQNPSSGTSTENSSAGSGNQNVDPGKVDPGSTSDSKRWIAP